MIAPNRDNNTHYQSQSPYAPTVQHYLSPSTGLSPHFHQQAASSSTNLHAQTLQYGSPQQLQAPSAYLNQPTPPQPQPQYHYGAAQSQQVQPSTPQAPLWSPQVSSLQQNSQTQYHQQTPPPLQPYPPAQPQPYQPPSISPHQSLSPLPPSYTPFQSPENQYPQQPQQHHEQNVQQHSKVSPNQNLPLSPAISPPSSALPRQTWSPPANNTSTWQTPNASATSEAPTAIPTPSAVELPAGEATAQSTQQAHQSSLSPSIDTAGPATVIAVSTQSQMPVESPRPQPSPNTVSHHGWTVGPSQKPQLQIPPANPNPSAMSPTPQAPGPVMSPPSQPGSAAEYFAYPPNPQPTPLPPATVQQQIQTPVMNYPPPSQWPHYLAANQQSVMPWQPPPQPEPNIQLQSYQSPASPPSSSPYQPLMPNDQVAQLQQGLGDLTVAPNLSSRFKEIARPVSTPAPPKNVIRNEPGPSVLRVQTEGHASALRKILCLDGGGVRGLASLMIVKHLMDRLEQQRGGRLEPWQEFDMIAGTSTGGLIAIMLGRLRMSVEETIGAYETLSRKIFTPVHSKGNIGGRAVAKLRADGKFESEPLEQAMKEMCRNRGLPETELLKDGSDDSPKVFVCAAQGINADTVVIRSYRSGDGEWDDLYGICKIWEAARATSAASTFFPPIQIGYQKYVDGALRYNNPIEKADQESRELWPNQERLIVSVGTGAAPGPNVLASNIMDLGKVLAKLVTDTEDENARFRKRNKDMVENNLLFRFNVLHGLADVKLSEWEALGEIMAHTGTYMKSPDTATAFNKCANMMKASGQRLGYIAGEDLDAYQKIQAMSTIYAEFCEDCHKGIPYLEKMFLCIECQIFTCEECHDSHEPSHLRNMLRFNVMQWIEKLPPGIQPSTPCRYCAKDAKSRWECQGCDMALCRNCVGYHDRRIEFFKEHRETYPDHRSFFATYPPYWSTETMWITNDCPCLDMTWFGGHCERCHRVYAGGQRGYFCRTCRSGFGSSQNLCLQCFERDEEHSQKHQFGTFEVVYEESGAENIQDMIKTFWGCSQCPERFAEGKQQNHAHLHLRLIITPFLVELLRRIAYQTCRRREIENSSKAVANPIPFLCDLCGKQLAFDQAGSLCLKKGCCDCFCSDCTLANRQSHRHYLYEFTVMRSIKNYMNQVVCNYCQQAYIVAMAQGLWCADCKNHFLCINCVEGIGTSGTPLVQEGLPHMKILKQCKVKTGWQLYIMDES